MRPGSLTPVAALVLSSWCTSCRSDGVRWNQVYGNSRNSSYAGVVTQDAGVPSWSRTLWTSPAPFRARLAPSAPVVGPDGRIFVSGSPQGGTGGGRLVCVDPSGNATVFDIATDGPTSVPAIADDGRIYFVMERLAVPKNPPMLFCLDSTGHALWSRGLSHFGALELDLEASPPKLHGNEVFVVTNSAAAPRLHAFDLDGNPIASVGLPGSPRRDHRGSSPQPPAITDVLLPSGSPAVVVLLHDALFAAGWVPGQGPIANPLSIVRSPGTWVGPPVIGSGGEIVAETSWGFEIYAQWSDQPTSVCSLPSPFDRGIGWPLAFLNDQADAHAYFSSATGVSLIAACRVLNQALMEFPSTPVVTKSHVFASARDGLNSLSLGLPAASHAMAPVFMNTIGQQPAVGPHGTIYEVVWTETDQLEMVVLRAFGASLQ